MTKLDIAQDAIGRALGGLGLAAEDVANARADIAALEARIARALAILGPLTNCLVEEQHNELAQLCDDIDAALRGRPIEVRELVA